MFSYLNEKALRKSLCPLVILLARGKIEIVSHRVLQNRNNPQWALPSPKFRRRRRTCLQLHRTPVPQASHRDHPVVGRDATIVTRFQGHHHLLWPRNAPDTLLPFARQGPSQLYLWRGTEEAQYPAHAGHLCSGGTSDGGPLAVSLPKIDDAKDWFVNLCGGLDVQPPHVPGPAEFVGPPAVLHVLTGAFQGFQQAQYSGSHTFIHLAAGPGFEPHGKQIPRRPAVIGLHLWNAKAKGPWSPDRSHQIH